MLWPFFRYLAVIKNFGPKRQFFFSDNRWCCHQSVFHEVSFVNPFICNWKLFINIRGWSVTLWSVDHGTLYIFWDLWPTDSDFDCQTFLPWPKNNVFQSHHHRCDCVYSTIGTDGFSIILHSKRWFTMVVDAMVTMPRQSLIENVEFDGALYLKKIYWRHIILWP